MEEHGALIRLIRGIGQGVQHVMHEHEQRFHLPRVDHEAPLSAVPPLPEMPHMDLTDAQVAMAREALGDGGALADAARAVGMTTVELQATLAEFVLQMQQYMTTPPSSYSE